VYYSSGAGYTLKMTTTSNADSEVILERVQKHIPNALIKSSQTGNTSELGITLPNETKTTSVFPDLFTELSNLKMELGIQTIGLSLTTMDEVFVKYIAIAIYMICK